MKILFLGCGSPIPTFIKRRIIALDARGVNIYLVADLDQKCSIKLKNGTYISQLEFSFKSLKLFVELIFSILQNPFRFLKLWKIFSKISFFQSFYIALKNWSFVRYKSFDLIHLQWLSMGKEFHWLKQFYDVPIIASARGSQVTIYPETRIGYKDFIQKCILSVDFIHCVSRSIQDCCVKLGAYSSITFLNYNGINTDYFFSKNKISWEKRKIGTIKLITVGSLMWRKGIHYQLLLLKKLLLHNIKVHLHVIGEGSDKEGLQYQSIRLGLKNYITWEGVKAESEIIHLLQDSDFYVSTSAAEGLSNSIVEAAACGLPVLAFDCEGMNEVVENGCTGFISQYGDIFSLEKNIIRIINGKVDYELLSSNARKKILSEFDESNCVDNQIENYLKILSKNNLF